MLWVKIAYGKATMRLRTIFADAGYRQGRDRRTHDAVLYRRLSKDHERCTCSSEGMIYVASIATLLKRQR